MCGALGPEVKDPNVCRGKQCIQVNIDFYLYESFPIEQQPEVRRIILNLIGYWTSRASAALKCAQQVLSSIVWK